MSRLPDGPDTTPFFIFNPLTEDFVTTYANEQNEPIEYICPSLKISEFPAYIGKKVAKNLAQYIVLKRKIKTNYQDEYQACLQEIEVKL